MQKSGRCALAKWALRSKEYVVQIRPAESDLVLQQLLYADEVRSLRDCHVDLADVGEPERERAQTGQVSVFRRRPKRRRFGALVVPERDGELLAPSCSYKQSECREREQESGRLWNRVDGCVARLVAWSPAASAVRRSVALARKIAGRPLAISRRGRRRNEKKERG